MDALANLGYDALDRGVIPDVLVRRAIRYLCNQRLKDIARSSIEDSVEHKWDYISKLKQNQVAIEQDKANEQHYEVNNGSDEARRPPDRIVLTSVARVCRSLPNSFNLAWGPTLNTAAACIRPGRRRSLKLRT